MWPRLQPRIRRERSFVPAGTSLRRKGDAAGSRGNCRGHNRALCGLAGRGIAVSLGAMFTGIVEEAGTVAEFAPTPRGWSLRVAARRVLAGVALGDSIAVNGCCLTVAEFDAGSLRFDVLEETRRLTSFRTLVPGAAVNLEGSLRFDGKVGGHFVTGHIDGPGKVEAFEPRGADHYLRVGFPAEFGAYVVPKGCIAIDGISLTVAECGPAQLAVWLIPHTLAVTNLRERRVGDTVNLEFDLLAKHVERLLRARGT